MPNDIVVTFENVAAIEAALTTAHDDLISTVDAIRADVDRMIIGWQVDTDSRRAQLAFDHRLAVGITAMVEALATIRRTLGDVSAAAHHAEVRNVAVLD